MNTKKQKIVKEILGRYSESEKNGILVCRSTNLNARETTTIKKKLWEVGSLSFVKNTLFSQVVKDIIKNEAPMIGSHIVVFAHKNKDIFNLMSTMSKTIKTLALNKKVNPVYVLLDNKYYGSEKDLKMFQSFQNKVGLQGGICMMLKIIPIKICKIIQLVVKQKE